MSQQFHTAAALEEALNNVDLFIPSIYSASYTVTTSVAGEKLATGTRKLSVQNKSTTAGEYITLGFGMTQAEANAVAAGANGKSIRVLPDTTGVVSVENYLYMAYIAATGSITVRIAQGV